MGTSIMSCWSTLCLLIACILFTGPGRALNQRLPSCPHYEKDRLSPSEFLIIGHSGGDPVSFCENTLESTRSALQFGANAIELDLSMSSDGVIFLWHDPEPYDMLTILRRLGFALSGRCSPVISTGTKASKLPFYHIRRMWHQLDQKTGLRSRVASLDEWLHEFGSDPRVRLLWLDVKLKDENQLPAFVLILESLLRKHDFFISINPNANTDEYYYNTIPDVHLKSRKSLQISVSDSRRARLIASLLRQRGLDGSRVVSDTVSLSPLITRTEISSPSTNGVLRAAISCGCCANLGKPVFALNSHEGLKEVVKVNVAQKELLAWKYGRRMEIYVWTVDDLNQMEWLIDSGVDGIITNRPWILAALLKRSKNDRP